jgi:antitoxin ParD1/3/4
MCVDFYYIVIYRSALMATLNISLPDSQASYVKECVESEGYQTTSEYFRTLIREDQKRKATEIVNALVLEGLNSPTRPVTDQTWELLRARADELLAKKAALNGNTSPDRKVD